MQRDNNPQSGNQLTISGGVRRSLAKIALACIAILATTTGAFASDKVVHLRLAETWPPNFPIFGDATHEMAKIAEEMSDGRLTISIDSANKHKAPFGIFDMVQVPASTTWATPRPTTGKARIPNTLFFTTMPFGMTAPEQYAWFYYGDGMELMQEVYDQYGVLSFPGGNTGDQMGGWFRKEINIRRRPEGPENAHPRLCR